MNETQVSACHWVKFSKTNNMQSDDTGNVLVLKFYDFKKELSFICKRRTKEMRTEFDNRGIYIVL